MKRSRSVLSIPVAIAGIFFILAGCDYDVPITAVPTRPVEQELLGDWTSGDWTKADCKDRMKVRKYDDSSYILSYNGDLYRAWHSDVGGVPFVTVQNLDSEERKFVYYLWNLSDGDKQLTLQLVETELIPKETRSSAAVVEILSANAGNPALFGDPAHFAKKEKAD